MPYTPKQRRLFHYREDHPGDGMSREEARRLAGEADRLAREGKEKKPKPKAKAVLRLLGRLLKAA